MSSVKINTPIGNAEVQEFFVSELGFLMMKTYLPEQKRWITYNLGIHDENDNIFTNSIINADN